MEPIDATAIQKGPKGDKGEKGEIGLQGWGLRGHTGCTGPIGDMTGPTGCTGIRGLIGKTGPTGPYGKVGSTGPIGDKGERGFIGMKGVKGDIGVKGPMGNASDLQTTVFSFGTFQLGHNTDPDIGLLPPGFFMGTSNPVFDTRLSKSGGLVKIDDQNPILCYHSSPFKKLYLKSLSYTTTDTFITGSGTSSDLQTKFANPVPLPFKICICKFTPNNTRYIANDHRISYFGTVDNKEFTNIKLPNLALNNDRVNTFKDKNNFLFKVNTAINPSGNIDLNDIEVDEGESVGIYIEVQDKIGDNVPAQITQYLPHPPYPKQKDIVAGSVKYSSITPLSMSIMGVYIS